MNQKSELFLAKDVSSHKNQSKKNRNNYLNLGSNPGSHACEASDLPGHKLGRFVKSEQKMENDCKTIQFNLFTQSTCKK